MDRDENLITLAVDSNTIIIVLVFVMSWGELNIDLLCNACWNHALLVVPNFEVAGLWGENM